MSRAKRKTTQTIVQVPTEDYLEFKRNHPAHGSWSWFVRECVRRFNDLHSTKPDELLSLVVESVKEDLEDEEE